MDYYLCMEWQMKEGLVEDKIINKKKTPIKIQKMEPKKIIK